MPSIVHCDNKDCLYCDGHYECCDADKLVIEHGVCAGSMGHGRNASENDLDEQLKAENAKLRELVRRLLTEYRYMRARPVYLEHEKRMRAIEDTMRELGIET